MSVDILWIIRYLHDWSPDKILHTPCSCAFVRPQSLVYTPTQTQTQNFFHHYTHTDAYVQFIDDIWVHKDTPVPNTTGSHQWICKELLAPVRDWQARKKNGRDASGTALQIPVEKQNIYFFLKKCKSSVCVRVCQRGRDVYMSASQYKNITNEPCQWFRECNVML